MDAKDRKILALLQADATLTAADLAEQVGLTTTPCWRRIQRLEEQGYIRNRVTLLDRHKMNVGITVFVAVRANRHASDWVERFRKVVQEMPEIIEAHRLSGDIDYLLRVVVPSIESFDEVYKKMIKSLEFTDVSSSFSMEELKYTTAIPVNYVE